MSNNQINNTPSSIENFDSLQADVDLEIVPVAFKKGMKSLGATARDHVAVPIDQLRFRENYNVRTHNEKYRERVEHYAKSMLANGFLQDKAITGFVAEENGEVVAYVVAGHTRVLAARRANELGANIEFIPMLSVPKGTNEVDLIFDLVISNDGSPLTLYEQGVVNKRLINRGITIAQIAERQQRSEAHIRNSLELQSAPRSIIEYVSDGRISETLALDLMRKHGARAKEIIAQGVEEAKAQGKKKVTSATVSGPKMPAPLGVSAISTVESIVLSLDSSVVEAAKAVSDSEHEAQFNSEATVSLPLSVVRELLALKEQIGLVREKHAKKANQAKANMPDSGNMDTEETNPAQVTESQKEDV